MYLSNTSGLRQNTTAKIILHHQHTHVHMEIPPMLAVYRDVRDGDKKQIAVYALGDKRYIRVTPAGEPATTRWVANAPLSDTGHATIDFNVPGKPNPPPGPIDIQFGTLQTPGRVSAVATFHDNSNIWVQIHAEQPQHPPPSAAASAPARAQEHHLPSLGAGLGVGLGLGLAEVTRAVNS